MQVNSVLDPVQTDKLGYALMHGHILVQTIPWCRMFPDWYDYNELIARAKQRVRWSRNVILYNLYQFTKGAFP